SEGYQVGSASGNFESQEETTKVTKARKHGTKGMAEPVRASSRICRSQEILQGCNRGVQSALPRRGFSHSPGSRSAPWVELNHNDLPRRGRIEELGRVCDQPGVDQLITLHRESGGAS